MNIVPNYVKRKRKRPKQKVDDSADMLLMMPKYDFETEAPTFPDYPMNFADMFLMKDDLDSIEKNQELAIRINSKVQHILSGKPTFSPGSETEWAHSLSDMALEWIARFYPKNFENSETFLSVAAQISSCRLNILKVFGPTITIPDKSQLDMFYSLEKILFERLTTKNDWTIDAWKNKLLEMEGMAIQALSEMKSGGKEFDPSGVDQDPRVVLRERMCAWQFIIRSRISLINNFKVEEAKIHDSARSKLFKYMDYYMSFQEANNFYQRFIYLVHSHLLPVCPRQLFLQARKRKPDVVEVSNAWEEVDPAFGRKVHSTISAANLRNVWKDLNHPHFDIFFLQAVAELFLVQNCDNFIDRYVVSSFQFADRLYWFYRSERDLNMRSPLIVNLLGHWYIQHRDRLIRCHTIQDVILTWLSETGDKTDDNFDIGVITRHIL